MLEKLRHRRLNWLAFGVACMLVVQLMLGGFMLGASATPAGAEDGFLGIICSASGDAAPAAPADHARLPNCCVLGCPGLANAALPPPAEAVSTAPIGLTELAVRYDRSTPAASAGDRGRVRARGPPRLPA